MNYRASLMRTTCIPALIVGTMWADGVTVTTAMRWIE